MSLISADAVITAYLELHTTSSKEFIDEAAAVLKASQLCSSQPTNDNFAQFGHHAVAQVAHIVIHNDSVELCVKSESGAEALRVAGSMRLGCG